MMASRRHILGRVGREIGQGSRVVVWRVRIFTEDAFGGVVE